MTIEEATRSNQTARRKQQTRHKKKTFTDRTYGARLPYEDARVLDDYAERNKLDGADVVRLAVKQFVARQGMKYQPKDAVRAVVEEVISEQLAPVIALPEKRSPHNDLAGQTSSPLREQKQLLERVLLASTLAMRLFVNYSVEPDLRAADALNADEIKAHLLAADSGRNAWCDLTKQVIKRTG
ncbi:MAG: hypothetical protein M3R15_28195 [Acidobacteriota bacterium]|nr:hypothetical protein [Acidobacteriota bacterium]